MDAWSELYPPFKTVMHGDVEVPLAVKPRLRDVPALPAPVYPPGTRFITAPCPTVIAWDGADIDAYFMAEDGSWKHCQTGAVWSGIKVAALFIAFMAVTLSCAIQLRLDAWPWELLS